MIGISAPWLAQELADALHVLGAADEGGRDPIGALLDREAQVVAVGGAEQIEREPRAAHVQALATAELAAAHDPAAHARSRDLDARRSSIAPSSISTPPPTSISCGNPVWVTDVPAVAVAPVDGA